MVMTNELDKILSKWSLLKHPFYEAWSAGTLPMDALKVYASEYGGFIRTLPAAWETLALPETSREEWEHAGLWDDFSAALGATPSAPAIPETKKLTDVATGLFGRPSTALGALYAFEAQQPATSASKLQGLKDHYALPAAAQRYFEVHAGNDHETAKILELALALPPDEQAEAIRACERMAEALWNGLSGIHRVACVD